MTKVLLTGAAGFIGHHVARHMLLKGWSVVSLDRLDEATQLGRLQPLVMAYQKEITCHWHDLRAQINPVHFRRYGDFDYIVHLAAASHVTRSVLDPISFVQDNVLGTANLLEYARHHHPQAKVLYFSTDEVMGPAPNDVEFTDFAAHYPNNPYAATKAAAEVLCPAWANTYGMKIVVTHCTNVYGPGQYEEKFIPLATGKILRGETIQIHSRGGVPSSRYYVHARDVAKAVVTVLERGGVIGSADTGKYNITGDQEYSNLHIAERIARILGLDARCELVEHVADRPRHDQRYALDGSRLHALGWAPVVSLEEGLAETVELLDVRRHS